MHYCQQAQCVHQFSVGYLTTVRGHFNRDIKVKEEKGVMFPSSFDGKDWDELSFEDQVYGPQNIVDGKIGIVRCKKTKEKTC